MSLPRWTHLRGTIMERTANSKLIQTFWRGQCGDSRAHTPHTHNPDHRKHQE